MNWRVLLADWRIGVADVCMLCCAALCCCAVMPLCCAVLCKSVPMLRHARASDIGVDITSRMLLILILILIASMGIYSALLVYYTLSQYLLATPTCYAYVLYLPSVLYQSYPSIILPIKKMRRMTISKLLAGAIASTVHTS